MKDTRRAHYLASSTTKYPKEVAYGRVQLDGHARQPLVGRSDHQRHDLSVPVALRPSVVVLAEQRTKAVLGHVLTFKGQFSRNHILQVFRKAMMPWSPNRSARSHLLGVSQYSPIPCFLMTWPFPLSSTFLFSGVSDIALCCLEQHFHSALFNFACWLSAPESTGSAAGRLPALWSTAIRAPPGFTPDSKCLHCGTANSSSRPADWREVFQTPVDIRPLVSAGGS